MLNFEFEDTFRCPQPWVRALVRNDGSVVPCCAFLGMKFDMGNIHKTSLKALWQGESWSKLRKMHQEGRYREEPICQECKVSRDGEFEEVLSIDIGALA